MKHRNFKRPVFAGLLLTLAFSLASAPAFTAESIPETETPATHPEALPSPIPLASVSTEQVETHKILRDLERWVQSDRKVSDIGGLFATKEASLSKLIEISIQTRFAEVPSGDLKESIKDWTTAIEQMDFWLDELKGTAGSLERDLKRLRGRRQIWSITLDFAKEQGTPQEFLQSIQTTLDRVISSKKSTEARRDETLILQTNISEFRMDLTKRIEMIGAELARRRQRALIVDSVPLWQAFGNPQVDRSLLTQIFSETQRSWREVVEYLRERPQRIAAQSILGLIFLFLVSYLGKHGVEKSGEDQEALEVLSIMRNRPLAAAVLLSTVLTEPLYPKAPEGWLRFMAFFLLLSLVRLLPGLLVPTLRNVPYFLAGLFVFHRISIMVPLGNLLNKTLLVALTIITTAAMVWGVKAVGSIRARFPSGWLHLLQVASGVGAVLGFISVFSVLSETRVRPIT